MKTMSPTDKGNLRMVGDNSEQKKANLPEEIILDIISRLPAKSVFQLQSLAKNFSSITKDRHFIDSHFRHSRHLRPSIILHNGTKFYLIRSNTFDSEITVEEVPLPKTIEIPSSNGYITLVGSCNGLVAIVVKYLGKRDCFLMNPVTHKCVHLPSNSRPPSCPMMTGWGFGYCVELKVYKIARFTYCVSPSSILVEVLNYGIDRVWRELKNFSLSGLVMLISGQEITINGVVYLNLSFPENKYTKFLTFNLEKEEFVWIFYPLINMSFSVIEFRESVAVCDASGVACNIWVPKGKDPYANSWKKLHACETSPWCSLNDRQLLMIKNDPLFYRLGKWVLYDMECKETKEILETSAACVGVEVLKFTESIVSLSALEFDSECDSSKSNCSYRF